MNIPLALEALKEAGAGPTVEALTEMLPELAPRKRHWHVHSSLGHGYLCECDYHYPYDTAQDRDQALRYERDCWRDYKYESEKPSSIRITGSIRDGYFDINDIDSLSWSRHVESWECEDPECYEEEDA
jgi:hypothetical protein